MANIRPALFIGLGSTGKEILENLVELMSEHYGSHTLSNLPIFRFIAFETDKGNNSHVNGIELKHLTITNTGYIKDHIYEKKYLKDWLDINLLDIPGGKFEDGASHIRMAGRLCLWENWRTVREIFYGSGGEDKGVVNIKESENIGKAEDTIRNYYNKIGKIFDPTQPIISDQPIVYVVGTLYGGTCSGMFIDIAYLAKMVFGLFAYQLPDIDLAPVRGIFTVCDSREIDAAADNQLKKIRAANCWAALHELDFWSHPETKYDMEFPDGQRLSTNESPFDWLYLISYSGPRPGEPLVSDFETLKHKVALNLFTEVVGDLLSSKNDIMTNFRSVVSLNQPNQNQCMRIIETFGIAAYWHPKYRISEAAASLYGEAEICEKWLGTKDIHADRIGEFKKVAASFCESIIEANKGELTANAREEIEGLFADRRDIMQKESKEFEQALRDKLNTLSEGGVYDKIISNDTRRDTFRKKLCDAIDADTKQRIDKIKDGTFTIEEIIHYLSEIDAEIKDTINKYPKYSLATSIASLSDISLEPDGWIKAVRKGKDLKAQEIELIRQKKEACLDKCKSYMLSQLENLTCYRMREPLKKLCQELGVEESLPDELRRAGYRTIKQKLEAVKNVIAECKKRFKEKAAEVSKGIKTTKDIEVITKGRNLEEDIKDLLALLKTDPAVKADMITDILTRDDGTIKPLSEFQQYGAKNISDETIFKSLSDSLIRIALDRVSGFDIAEKVLNSIDLPIIRRFAKQSQPHLELTGDLPSNSLTLPPKLLVGKGAHLADLNNRLNDRSAQDRIGFNRIAQTDEIDHMLIFYTEEACLYRDTHLAAAKIGLYPKVCDEIEEKVRKGKSRQKDKENEVPYTVFTHKRGKEYFDPNIYIRKKHAEELIDIAKDIFSTFDDNGKFVSSEVFKNTGKFLKHEFKNPVTKIADDLRGDETGINKMAQGKVIYDYFNDVIHKKIKEIGKDGFIERFNNYLRWKNSFEEAKGKLSPEEIDNIINEKREKYTHIMNDYFPEEKNT